MGFLTLLIVTFLYILPSAKETLPLIFVIACGLPQLVWVLSVIYRQLKGNQVARYIAGKFCTLVKQILNKTKRETNFQMTIHCIIKWLILTTTTDLCFPIQNKHVSVLKHIQYQEKYHLCTLMVQSAYPTEVDFIQDFCNILAVILCIFIVMNIWAVMEWCYVIMVLVVVISVFESTLRSGFTCSMHLV